MSVEYKYKETCLADPKVIAELLISLDPYIKKLKNILNAGKYEDPECSINLPFDPRWANDVTTVADNFDLRKIKYLVLVGIGGSNLGTQAIYEALKTDLTPEILFADTVSEKTINGIISKLSQLNSKEEFVLDLVCKSGSTVETNENFSLLINFLSRKFGKINNRVVITTGFDSSFWNEAKNKDYFVLEIPKLVGGRYSVFSPVGLFPLLALGFDIKKLLSGAKGAFDNLDTITTSAVISVAHYQKGIGIHNNFFFNPSLEFLGKWQRQLTAESLGKTGKGILPIVSIGSMDLHSMVQLYLGGPKNIYTDFMYSEEFGERLPKVMEAIYKGTVGAYKNAGVPFSEFALSKIDEFLLGYYMQFRMAETVFQAKLLGVNAFDQPNVEDYKQITREILGK